MTTVQKIIKYLAIAFAIFLILNIVSGILGLIFGFSFIFGLHNRGDYIINEEIATTNFEYEYIDTLDIDVDFSNLIIKTGNEFKVEGNNNYINCRQNEGTIHIEEKGHHWFSRNNSGELVIYIPEKLEFEKAKITTGAGKINIEKIVSKRLSLEIGAGETQIGELQVENKAEIDGGAGKVTISSGTINDLDLDMGVGKVELNAKLTGNAEIDAGIGELDINIFASKDEYKIKASKGIGSINIDGKGITEDTIYGEGENYIELDGGIGNIRMNFKENKR